jgi:biopolymer transport protein ExbD
MRILLLIAITFISCNQDKKILLPKTAHSVVKDIKDISPVYFFFNQVDKDTLIEVNRKNVISTTNWIFNIDKRLPLRIVVPELVKLQTKKKSPSMHQNPDSNIYFSYADTIRKNLGFVPFTNVEFSEKIYHSNDYIKKYPEFHIPFESISIDFRKDKNVLINDVLITDENTKDFLADFIQFQSENKTVLIYLNFDERLTFGDYLSNKIFIYSLLTSKILLAPNEFIYK